jgi:hypothetical protein
MVECLPCAMQNHESCWLPNDRGLCCCPTSMWDGEEPQMTLASLTGTPYVPTGSEQVKETQGRGGQVKDADAVTDRESTGRKRAAKMFPIVQGMPCEWAGLKLAGGGVIPIMGCIREAKSVAKDIHHGPNKSTLANFVGNVHRICPTCHNRWHSLNDKYYDSIRPLGLDYYPQAKYVSYEHLPFVYPTDIERAQNEIAWLQGKASEFLTDLKSTETDKLKPLTRPTIPAILNTQTNAAEADSE